jgi:hypothetical protein
VRLISRFKRAMGNVARAFNGNAAVASQSWEEF